MIFSIAVCIWWIDVSTYKVLEQIFYVLICDYCCGCHVLTYPLWNFVIIYLLSGSLPLPWSIRMKIALGAAKGLAFLHEEAERPVIYRDFKTSNILLDAVCSNTLANWSLAHFYYSSNKAFSQDYNAKLSDFGLAKDAPEGDKTHVSTRVMGTYGYAAPEYVMTGKIEISVASFFLQCLPTFYLDGSASLQV